MLPMTYAPGHMAAYAEAVEQQVRRELACPTPAATARPHFEALHAFTGCYYLPIEKSATPVMRAPADRLVTPGNSAIIASRIKGANGRGA